MKIILGIVLFCLWIATAHSESFFNAEIGLGGQWSKDMGDGIWYQQALPHAEKMSSPAYMAGFTGTLLENGRWKLDYHADYVYFGDLNASCMCVPDASYDPHTHQTVGQLPRLSQFNGHGHVQLLSITLSPSYLITSGFRIGIEAGPTMYWHTWHESVYDLNNQWDNLSHKTKAQLGWTSGVTVSRGKFTVAYHYYYIRQQWNPYPGIVTGTHMLMLQYRF